MPLSPMAIPFPTRSSQWKEIEKQMGRDPFKQSRKLQAIDKEREPKPMKGVLQVFLPLSILCFLLSNYYSSCLPNMNLSSTTTLLNNINHFIDRKAIFLFSNAILLFLVKESGLLCHRSSPVDRLYDEFTARKGDHSRLKTDAVETEANVAEAREESGESLELVMIEERGDEERMAATQIKAHVVEEKPTVESGKALELVAIEAGDEEGMELVGINEMKDVGVDELNRRSEEFIESVKKGWRMEALQVVMV